MNIVKVEKSMMSTRATVDDFEFQHDTGNGIIYYIEKDNKFEYEDGCYGYLEYILTTNVFGIELAKHFSCSDDTSQEFIGKLVSLGFKPREGETLINENGVYMINIPEKEKRLEPSCVIENAHVYVIDESDFDMVGFHKNEFGYNLYNFGGDEYRAFERPEEIKYVHLNIPQTQQVYPAGEYAFGEVRVKTTEDCFIEVDCRYITAEFSSNGSTVTAEICYKDFRRNGIEPIVRKMRTNEFIKRARWDIYIGPIKLFGNYYMVTESGNQTYGMKGVKPISTQRLIELIAEADYHDVMIPADDQ